MEREAASAIEARRARRAGERPGKKEKGPTAARGFRPLGCARRLSSLSTCPRPACSSSLSLALPNLRRIPASPSGRHQIAGSLRLDAKATMAQQEEVDPRRLVRLEAERVANVRRSASRAAAVVLTVELHHQADLTAPVRLQIGGSEFPAHYPGEDHTWDVRKFTSVRFVTPLVPPSRPSSSTRPSD